MVPKGGSVPPVWSGSALMVAGRDCVGAHRRPGPERWRRRIGRGGLGCGSPRDAPQLQEIVACANECLFSPNFLQASKRESPEASDHCKIRRHILHPPVTGQRRRSDPRRIASVRSARQRRGSPTGGTAPPARSGTDGPPPVTRPPAGSPLPRRAAPPSAPARRRPSAGRGARATRPAPGLQRGRRAPRAAGKTPWRKPGIQA